MWRPAVLQKAEAALLDEKAAKIRGLAQMLDDLLGASFDAHLAADGPTADLTVEQRLAALAEALRPITDRLAAAFPRVGLGYYDLVCDRIVAYAPSEELGYLVGVSPPSDHLGREAMELRSVRIAVGSMVRGDALNCMHPLIRDDRVIGFAFANESVEDIYRQMRSTKQGQAGQGVEISTALGLSSLAVFAGTTQLSAEALRAQLSEAMADNLVDAPYARPLMGALQQVAHYVRLFLDNLGVPVIIVDQEKQVSYCNKEMIALCDAAAPGKSWAEIVERLELELDDRGVGSSDQQVLHTEATVGGRQVAFNLLVCAVPGLPGHHLYLFDEAARASREGDYFERAERLAMAGELATSIAHEIRNPLTVVAGSIQLIPDRVDDREFLLSLSRIAGEELARVNRIIQGLLGFAKFSEPERAMIDLNGLVRETVEFLDWYAKKGGVTVKVELAPRNIRIHGDREHLKQALLNLMMNGIQAMEGSPGTLTVRTDQPEDGRRARIAVIDEGEGMSPETLSDIWKVFYSSKEGGTGLGLPVVQRIIDAHHGYIEVESAPGKGSCFTILLPVASRPSLLPKGGE